MTATRTRRNVTQGDVILAMLAQEANKAQDRVQNAEDGTDRTKAIAERNILITLRDRVRRYLDGDASALY